MIGANIGICRAVIGDGALHAVATTRVANLRIVGGQIAIDAVLARGCGRTTRASTARGGRSSTDSDGASASTGARVAASV